MVVKNNEIGKDQLIDLFS